MAALPIPSLTFSRTEKGEEFLTKDQVTHLITEVQRAHKEAVSAALAAPQGEVTRLEAALKEAQKGGSKAADLERELVDLRGQVDRRDVAGELLGLTDPGEIGDLHGLYQSRTASLEPDKRPAFRDWVAAGITDPSQAPALARSVFEAAAKRGSEAGTGAGAGASQGGQAQPGGQQGPSFRSDRGRSPATPPGGGAAGQSVRDLQAARAAGMTATEFYHQRFRPSAGLPPIKTAVDGGGKTE